MKSVSRHWELTFLSLYDSSSSTKYAVPHYVHRIPGMYIISLRLDVRNRLITNILLSPVLDIIANFLLANVYGIHYFIVTNLITVFAIIMI